ncbi:hypothetical protein ACH0AH_02900 [Microbacterium paludicola]|uniref:hypothetical protein n=1 Tax=Microbacterium paludicola TaxID=300019 RepID=UPI00387A37FB
MARYPLTGGRRWVATVAAAGLLLTGCAPSGGQLPGTPGASPAPGSRLDVAGYEDSPPLPAAVQAYEEAGVLTVITTGSSSCPAVPEVADVRPDEQLVILTITPWRAEFCTADMAPRTFTFDVGRDLRSFTVEVQSSGDGG